ncbi:MAG: cellulase family glycosylhydrolase [Capsulimonadales bacterium]|nr:cellulase family glycosylhydrolase [Capsulimonadales bacterium]
MSGVFGLFGSMVLLTIPQTIPQTPPRAQRIPESLPGPIVPEGFGVNIHFTDPQPGEMERFAEAGYAVARMDLFWHQVETEKGKYDFSAYDRLTESLRKVGARPLFILDYGNDLYEKGSPRSPESRAAFARFAGAAAAHFRGKGVIFEIWNEPNIHFWQPSPDVAQYSALALETAKAVKAADPRSTLIAPGLSGFGWEFFEGVFRAGLLQYLDGVSVHPYRGQEPESAAEDFARLRALIARYAPSDKRQMPILSSEWGYSTVEGGPISEATQARYLTRMWLANLASGVHLSIFYDWKEDGPDPKENEHHFGTVRPDLTPKPAFLAAKHLIAELRGYHFRHRLKTANPEEWRLLFQKGDAGDLKLVTWRADRKASDAEATPKVTAVTKTDPAFRDLLRLASVRWPAGALAESTGMPPDLKITFQNPETEEHRVRALIGGPTVDVGASVPPGATRTVAAPWSMPAGRVERREPVPVTIVWGGQPLSIEPMPLNVRRIDTISLTALPAQTDLALFLENPARTAFDGTAVLKAGEKVVARRPVTLKAGEERGRAFLPHPKAATVSVVLQDEKGNEISVLPPSRYVPMSEFPNRPTADTGFGYTLFVENAARKPTPLPAVPAPDRSPGETALRIAYRFDPGWRYAGWTSEKPWPIPEKARALTLWVHATASGDMLRSRFRDATGQTFQIDLGALDWKGWKTVTIPLDGTRVGVSWGGANDGKVHGARHWETLLLIDSVHRTNGSESAVLITAPYYVIE